MLPQKRMKWKITVALDNHITSTPPLLPHGTKRAIGVLRLIA
jgi:hypothetical protein